MPTPPFGTEAWIVQAERILAELDQETERALDALAREDTVEVLAAVESRGPLLAQLDETVADLAGTGDNLQSALASDESLRWFVQRSANALASHHDLLARVAIERDRLSSSITALNRNDRVAARYGAGSPTAANSLSLSA